MLNVKLKIILILGLFAVSTTSNASIVYMADGRYIDHTLSSGPYVPTSPYADFNDDWWAWEAGAFQNTALTSSTMSGSGSTYAGFDAMNYGAEATSVFAVTFGVDQLSDFSLTGSLDTGWWGGSELFVILKENGNEIFYYDQYLTTDIGVNPFSLSGQFSVGNTYELVLGSYSFDSDYYYEEWQFDLTTSPVPVPAALWLFASGLIGLIGVARRKSL